jgi:hypothetical protein
MTMRVEIHEMHPYITNITNPNTWLMAWKWRHFLLAPNTSMATFRPSQIALN